MTIRWQQRHSLISLLQGRPREALSSCQGSLLTTPSTHTNQLTNPSSSSSSKSLFSSYPRTLKSPSYMTTLWIPHLYLFYICIRLSICQDICICRSRYVYACMCVRVCVCVFCIRVCGYDMAMRVGQVYIHVGIHT